MTNEKLVPKVRLMGRKVLYTTKFIFYYVFLFVETLLCVPFMIPKGRDSRNGLLPAWILTRGVSLFFGITYEIRGLENILPPGQGCMLVFNHQSSLDIVALSHIWKYVPNGATVSKREVIWVYPFCWLWNTVFINRLRPDKAKNDLNMVGSLIRTKQVRICMFPEGTRHSSDELLPFKKGAFHIALTAQCPIQPVVVSKYHFLEPTTGRFESGHNIIEVLPTIPTNGLSTPDLDAVTEKTRNVMQEAYTRISAETFVMKKKFD